MTIEQAANTAAVVRRVIREVAGTIATNGIQELDKTERGGVSQFGYVRACLMATAYNALRAMPNFGDSYASFCNRVLAQVDIDLAPESDICEECGVDHGHNGCEEIRELVGDEG